ncbi:MAG: chorismate mutase [Rhodothermales bacterium]
MLIEAVQDLIKLLEEETPQVPEAPSPDDMETWRERIDLIDKAMLQIMNERVQCANRIGAIKKKLGLPVYVPSREEDVIRNVVAGNEGPLSDAAVRRLFERVIDETRSLERHKYQDPDQE